MIIEPGLTCPQIGWIPLDGPKYFWNSWIQENGWLSVIVLHYFETFKRSQWAGVLGDKNKLILWPLWWRIKWLLPFPCSVFLYCWVCKKMLIVLAKLKQSEYCFCLCFAFVGMIVSYKHYFIAASCFLWCGASSAFLLNLGALVPKGGWK